jgi:hypothetical protein
MGDLEVGDLVEVIKNNDLSPTLRFFHNKQGMIVRLIAESRHLDEHLKEWEVLFADGRRAAFKHYELKLIAKANEKQKN